MSRKPHDFELWTELAQTISPLLKRKSARLSPVEKPKPRPSAPQVHLSRPALKTPPPITGFDRRTTQKMTRGNVEIERRIDLHGTGVEMARVRLLQFLQHAYGEGARTVLVITGKGDSPYARHTLHGAAHFHAPERQGRLIDGDPSASMEKKKQEGYF